MSSSEFRNLLKKHNIDGVIQFIKEHPSFLRGNRPSYLRDHRSHNLEDGEYWFEMKDLIDNYGTLNQLEELLNMGVPMKPDDSYINAFRILSEYYSYLDTVYRSSKTYKNAPKPFNSIPSFVRSLRNVFYFITRGLMPKNMNDYHINFIRDVPALKEFLRQEFGYEILISALAEVHEKVNLLSHEAKPLRDYLERQDIYPIKKILEDTIAKSSMRRRRHLLILRKNLPAEGGGGAPINGTMKGGRRRTVRRRRIL